MRKKDGKKTKAAQRRKKNQRKALEGKRRLSATATSGQRTNFSFYPLALVVATS